MVPDFICIGAQKAGTTWLYQNVGQHPGAWMPPLKEIHYFDHPSAWPVLTWLLGRGRGRRPSRSDGAGAAGVLSPLERRRIARLAVRSLPGNVRCLSWFWRYLLWPRNDGWYASLFRPGAGQVAGDVTPAYARLEARQVARVHALVPEARIIYVLRNPIARTWSQAAMVLAAWSRARLESVAERRILEFIDDERNARNSDYMCTLQTWERFYQDDRLHVVFFDQLVQDPKGFYESVCRFLGLDASRALVPRTVCQRRNPGPRLTIPDRFARHLAGQYCEQIEQLHRRFDNRYTAGWLDFARRYL